MVKNLALFILLTTCVTVMADAQSMTTNDLVGEYDHGSNLSTVDGLSSYRSPYSSTLTLRSDGTYTAGSPCSPVIGRYSYVNSVLTLKAGTSGPTRCFYSVVIPPGEAGVYKDPPKPKDETLVPVRWSERIYLVQESGWTDFTDSINAGLLPHRETERNLYLGPFYRRLSDETKVASGPPDIPVEWRAMILDKPVEATIARVEELKDGQFMATVKLGSQGGLREGVPMYPPDCQNLLFGKGWVKTVTGTEAQVLFYYKVEVGETLSTRLKRPAK